MFVRHCSLPMMSVRVRAVFVPCSKRTKRSKSVQVFLMFPETKDSTLSSTSVALPARSVSYGNINSPLFFVCTLASPVSVKIVVVGGMIVLPVRFEEMSERDSQASCFELVVELHSLCQLFLSDQIQRTSFFNPRHK